MYEWQSVLAEGAGGWRGKHPQKLGQLDRVFAGGKGWNPQSWQTSAPQTFVYYFWGRRNYKGLIELLY